MPSPTPLARSSPSSRRRSPLSLSSSVNLSYVSPPPLKVFSLTYPHAQTDSFSRLVRESLEARERNQESHDYDDEKMMVQMNILKTIEQLISSLDGTDLLVQVENIVAPALEVTLRNNLVGECARQGEEMPELT